MKREKLERLQRKLKERNERLRQWRKALMNPTYRERARAYLRPRKRRFTPRTNEA